ncbi:hypothetical protein GCM10010532_077100 [Dactylosporangium siamense]|uniref:Uncharacterized protein n=1 Tax=Dactylosporangium siamense TaxID=685454 RepID=A0A919PPK4_9ACTN|nr:hypothetical protein Dsi01nite_057300 [Dactylosporangium siamense]
MGDLAANVGCSTANDDWEMDHVGALGESDLYYSELTVKFNSFTRSIGDSHSPEDMAQAA